MTKEKRLEALAWLIDQAEAHNSAVCGIKFSDDITVERLGLREDIHLWGDGFYELARAASQTVKTEPFDETSDREYFLFDQLRFFRLVDKAVKKDG